MLDGNLIVKSLGLWKGELMNNIRYDFQKHIILLNLLPPETTGSSLQTLLVSEEPINDVIVDNPFELIDVVLENKGYISCVMWWDRVKTNKGSRIGMGGPRDPRNPNMYYFAEVAHLDRYFDESTSKEEYCKHIRNILSTYPNNDLYPGFDIRKKRKLTD